VAWHPDGKSIAVSTASGKVFVASLDSHSVRLVFNGLPFTDEHVPNIAFSRRGDFLYVLSQPGTGESYDLLKMPIAGGAPVKVLEGRLTNFAESPDGRTLFYSRTDGLWKRPVQGGVEQLVTPAYTLWDVKPDGLYMLTNSSSIERYSFDGRHHETIARTGSFGVSFPLSVSSDSRSALVGYEQRKTSEIDMIHGID
jgi:WD40 repeat protein